MEWLPLNISKKSGLGVVDNQACCENNRKTPLRIEMSVSKKSSHKFS